MLKKTAFAIASLIFCVPVAGFSQTLINPRIERDFTRNKNITLNTSLSKDALRNLFDEQVKTLIDKGYPRLANQTKREFVNSLLGLRNELLDLSTDTLTKYESYVPFLIVIPDTIVTMPEQLRIALRAKKSFQVMPAGGNKIVNAGAIFSPTEPYLLININWKHLSVKYPPGEAMTEIKKEGLRPLTVEESIALLLHHQDIMETYNIAALGSRFGSTNHGFPVLVRTREIYKEEVVKRFRLGHVDRDGLGGFISAYTDLETIAPVTPINDY